MSTHVTRDHESATDRRQLVARWIEHTQDVLEALKAFLDQHDRLAERAQVADREVVGLQQQVVTLRASVANLDGERSSLLSIVATLERDCAVLRTEREAATESIPRLLNEVARSISDLAQKFGPAGAPPVLPVPKNSEPSAPAPPRSTPPAEPVPPPARHRTAAQPREAFEPREAFQLRKVFKLDDVDSLLP